MQVMIKNLEQVVSMVLNSFQDPHPRVRWAAINAIGQLSTDLGPDLQNLYHLRVLPALASAMDDFQNPRVQVNCLKWFGNPNCCKFCQEKYLWLIIYDQPSVSSPYFPIGSRCFSSLKFHWKLHSGDFDSIFGRTCGKITCAASGIPFSF